MSKLSGLVSRSRNIFTKSFVLTFVLVFFLVLALLTSYYFYSKYQSSKQSLSSPQEVGVEQEIESLKKKIGALIELPKGEEPIPATVSDITKLKDQVFFTNAKNGDKVLIYSKAKLAVLYRPSTNKIINVAPVNLGETSVSPTKGQAYKIVLYNGTKTVGLTTKHQQDLYSKTKEFEVLDRDNASVDTYNKTLVIDFIGNSTAAKTLATFMGGEVAPLPSGEEKPEGADFLVILGE